MLRRAAASRARQALARSVLRSLPSDARRRFGDQILCDLDAEPDRFARHLFDIVKAGLTMRVDDLVRDFTYALARLRRAPLFVAMVTLTFALGIGANVAVFSALDAIVLQPLPFAHPDRLVAIFKRTQSLDTKGPLSRPDVSDLRSQLHGVTSISAIESTRATLTFNGTPRTVHGASVSATFFNTLGTVAQAGRLFGKDDALAGRHDAVISDLLWRSYFNADPGVVGKRIDLDGVSYAIVGVAPPDLQVPNPHPLAPHLSHLDFFTALPDMTPSTVRARGGTSGVVALLAPDTTVAQLNAELLIVSQRLRALYPQADAHVLFWARSLTEELVSPVASSLWMVLFAVFGIVLIASANVANLIATRWSAREHEVAIRRALGASYGRIAAQLFTETGILAVCGGVVGVGLAYLCLQFIPLGALDAVLRGHPIAIRGTTLLYALLIVCLSTVLAGLAPVHAIGRAGLQLVLNSAGRSGTSRRNGLRSALVVGEVAVALALVVSAGLVVRSYLALTHAPLGIRPDGVYETGFFAMSKVRYPTPTAQLQAKQRLLSQIEALPGVDAAATTMSYPLGDLDLVFAPHIFGKQATNGPNASLNNVSPGYFRALGIPLLRGRAFNKGDSGVGAPVAIVNQAFADKFLQSTGGVGQRVEAFGGGENGVWATVVGIVANDRQQLNKPPVPTLYQPIAQGLPFSAVSVIVHAPNSSLETERKQIQSAFASVFPESPRPDVYTVASRIAELTKTERSAAALLGSLGLVPLLLALSGIFGVVSYSIAHRSREFGVRIALGARAHDILGDVLRRSLSMTALGVAVGTIFAALAARAIAPKIIISPLDPLTFGTVIVMVVLASTVAALIPATRAMRVDPVVALRSE